MKRFKEYLVEVFNSPYPILMSPTETSITKPSTVDEVTFKFRTALGVNGRIVFNRSFGSGDMWSLEFFVGDSQDVTGEGDAYKIFATVIESIKKFIAIFKPTEIYFSAYKKDANNSRADLYLRLIKTFAKSIGFRFELSDSKTERSFLLIKEQKLQ